jgi:hypothetical protein
MVQNSSNEGTTKLSMTKKNISQHCSSLWITINLIICGGIILLSSVSGSQSFNDHRRLEKSISGNNNNNGQQFTGKGEVGMMSEVGPFDTKGNIKQERGAGVVKIRKAKRISNNQRRKSDGVVFLANRNVTNISSSTLPRGHPLLSDRQPAIPLTTEQIQAFHILPPLEHQQKQRLHLKQHFLLYSTMNIHYFQHYTHYQQPTKRYAQLHNYTFLFHPNTFTYEHFRLRGKSITPHYYRIYAALQLLRQEVKHYNSNNTMPNIDWLVYIDSDAFITESNLPLEAIIHAVESFQESSISTDSKEHCHFIAQEHGAIINSGFFFLRNSPWSIQLLERWIQECEKAGKPHRTMRWVWDQGPLQNAILHVS